MQSPVRGRRRPQIFERSELNLSIGKIHPVNIVSKEPFREIFGQFIAWHKLEGFARINMPSPNNKLPFKLKDLRPPASALNMKVYLDDSVQSIKG